MQNKSDSDVSTHPPVEALVVEAPTEDRDIIEAAFSALPTQGYACWTPVETGIDHHEAYFEDADDADRGFNALNLQRLARSNPASWTLNRKSIAETDWANAWKAHFQIETVSERIVIRPVWEAYQQREGEIVIHIDPGMSFGTGRHETTRSCLQFLDRVTAQGHNGSFLDLGCGSGILAIGAAKLGLHPVMALDYDPDAVQGAIENLERNDLASQIKPFVGDVRDLHLPHTFDLVAANILAPVLIEHAASIAGSVAASGLLILSGILETQYADVRSAYEQIGLQQRETIRQGEWTSGLFAKTAG
jgi:ribosomal protein L11 methyltransferase